MLKLINVRNGFSSPKPAADESERVPSTITSPSLSFQSVSEPRKPQPNECSSRATTEAKTALGEN